MSTTTTNFTFVLPAVNSPTDEDLWGGQLNSNWTSLDALLFLTDVVGKKSLPILGSAFAPTVSNGATATSAAETTSGRPDLIGPTFGASADEFTQFQMSMPKSWNEGTFTYVVNWSGDTTSTNPVIWQLEALAVSDGDTVDAAYGTAVTVSDAGSGTVKDLNVATESAAVTAAGTPQENDMVFFRFGRLGSDGSDTYTGIARLLSLKINITTDGRNDV